MINSRRDQNYVTSLLAASNADGITPVVLWADPVTHRLLVQSTGGAGLTLIAFTGAVNGANLTFTAASSPTYVVSDGVWYRATDANSLTQWSYAGGTVTLSIAPPNYDIYGF